MLVPSGNCFPQNVASPSESKNNHNPQTPVFEEFVFWPSRKGGGHHEDCSLETARSNKSWNCHKTLKNS